jgi:hypothetical protein
VVKYRASCPHSTNIFLIASIVFLTVGSGFLARAGMHYADATENNSIGRDISECPGCVTNDKIIGAYSESIRVKLQDDLQDMIFNAGIGIALFSMGAGFSAVYMRYYRNVQPIL